MASKYEEIPYLNLKGGVNYAAPPHEVGPNEWTVLEGMRYERGVLVQIPHLVQVRNLTANPLGVLLPLFVGAAPTYTKDYMHVYVAASTLNTGVVFYLRLGDTRAPYFTQLKQIETGTAFTFPLVPRETYGGPTVPKMNVGDYLAAVLYKNQWWCTTKSASLFCLSQGKVIQPTGLTLPKASQITQFYDHLLVGNYSLGDYVNPNGIAACDLLKPWNWTATPENEADTWDIEEFTSTEGPGKGVTGFYAVGDRQMVMTDSSIVVFDYVGLPNILRYNRVRPDIGNALPRGLVTYGGLAFFFDRKTYNFYQYNGMEMQPIGDKILSYVEDVLPETPDNTPHPLFEYTYGYVQPKWGMVCWAIPYSTTYLSNTYWGWKNIGYNPFTKTWVHWGHSIITSGSTDIVLGAASMLGPTSGTTPATIDEATDDIDDVDDLIDVEPTTSSMSFSAQHYVHLSSLLRDQTSSSDTQYRTVSPVLETGDRFYGSLHKTKEIAGFVFHSSYTTGSGIEVSVSARNNISDAVTYQVVGVWNPSLPDKRLTFPAVSGRIFRYRFRGLGDPTYGEMTGWRLDAFSELVYGNSAER